MKFVNVSGTPQDLPHLGENGTRVAAGDEVDATGDAAKSLQSNPAFERSDKPKSSTDTEEK